MHSRFLTQYSVLVFKQIVKSASRVIWPCCGSRGCLFFDAHADGKKLAFVAGILFGDSLRHRLHAFESARRIEIGALLAGMQFKTAFQALTQRLRKQSQQIATLRASRNGVRSRHLHRSRSERVLPGRTLRRSFRLFCAAVLVSSLTVFAVGQEVS